MKRILKTCVISVAIIIGTLLGTAYYFEGGLNFKYDTVQAINLYGFDIPYVFDEKDKALIESALSSGIIVKDDDTVDDNFVFIVATAYNELDENVRKEFEKGGGKIYLNNNIVSDIDKSNSDANGYFYRKGNKYYIKMLKTGGYRSIKNTITHEMGHFVDYKLNRISKEDFWTEMCHREGFAAFMARNVNDNLERESFAETATLTGIKKVIFDKKYPGAYEFVKDQWNKVGK